MQKKVNKHDDRDKDQIITTYIGLGAPSYSGSKQNIQIVTQQ